MIGTRTPHPEPEEPLSADALIEAIYALDPASDAARAASAAAIAAITWELALGPSTNVGADL